MSVKYSCVLEAAFDHIGERVAYPAAWIYRLKDAHNESERYDLIQITYDRKIHSG